MVAVMHQACLPLIVREDSRLGAKAEYLNAWSVVERLLGLTPSAGDSAVSRSVVSVGEVAGVVLVKPVIGGFSLC
jgi:hypothetical protein